MVPEHRLGLAEPGHNFIFANPNGWQTVIPASVESHRGKHGPMFAVRQDELPTPVENYLRKFFEPTEAAPYDRKYNHGWIASPPETISWDIQAQVYGILEGGGPS